MSKTPVTRSAMREYEKLKPVDAVIVAWANAGNHPAWHRKMQKEVREAMPLLGLALDRLVKWTPKH